MPTTLDLTKIPVKQLAKSLAQWKAIRYVLVEAEYSDLIGLMSIVIKVVTFCGFCRVRLILDLLPVSGIWKKMVSMRNSKQEYKKKST